MRSFTPSVCTILAYAAFGVAACGGSTFGGTTDGSGGASNDASGGTTASGGAATSGGAPSAGGAINPGVPGWPPEENGPMIWNGRIDPSSNDLGIQGDIFASADSETDKTLRADFVETTACISGTAEQVDPQCELLPPATDCYDQIWGAALSMNLNQAIDGEPMPFDATALKGFGFAVSGDTIPASLRFEVETSSGEFCTPPEKPILEGANTVLFDELKAACWTPSGAAPDTSDLLRVSWKVVTNAEAEVPFDFCVRLLVAIPK